MALAPLVGAAPIWSDPGPEPALLVPPLAGVTPETPTPGRVPSTPAPATQAPGVAIVELAPSTQGTGPADSATCALVVTASADAERHRVVTASADAERHGDAAAPCAGRGPRLDFTANAARDAGLDTAG